MTIHDVAVLGAGVAGSSLAKVLAEYGWNTVLIDQDTFPRHKVCGEFLSPESQRSLAALGLDQIVRALAPTEIHQVSLTLPTGKILALPLPGSALGISRYVLDPALHVAVHMAGGMVLEGSTVTSVSEGEQGFVIGIRNKGERKEIRARAAIAAWGRNPRAGLPRTNRKPPYDTYVGVKTHLEGIKPKGVVELYFFPGGYLGISPIEGGRLNMAALLTRQAFDEAGKTVVGAIELAACRCPKLQQRLSDASLVPGTQLATAPVDTNRALVAWDQIAHIGDAAMIIPPLCGDGMAMGLYSAEICAPFVNQYLHRQISLKQWQHQYAAALLREISGPIRWGRLLQRLLGSPMLSQLALRLGTLAPGAAYRLVEATRLKR